MKIIFLNIYYEEFLKAHYAKNNIANLSYLEQWESIQGTMFGDSDFYSRGMSKQGWETHDLITNCKPLQMQWAKENEYSQNSPIWVQQIRKYKPDVVYAQGLWLINNETHAAIKNYYKLIVGQVGSALDSFETNRYDLMFTAIVPYVDRFRDVGVPAHYLPLAFEPRVLEKLGELERDIPISFVGQLTSGHSRRKAVLDALSKEFDVQQFIGKKWGMDMFEIMARSYIAINCNIDVEIDYVGNMRLYEATGCGALTLTDEGINLGELFEDDELLKYRNPEEAIELVRYYFENKKEGELIAAKGQKRTITDHTYEQRMSIVADVLEKML